MPLARILDACVAAASLPAVGAAGYLAALTALSGSVPHYATATSTPFFDVIIPAHNEAEQIAATLASVFAIDYPPDAFRVIVVADNCADMTADVARAAGANVIERADRKKRGKGHALARAFEATLADGRARAVVVVDADTQVTPNILRAFAARLEAGETLMQAEHGVRNPNASWRTRLMVIALAAFHTLRSNARERLRISCGLRGNGMGLACSVLRAVPYDAFSIVEDIEYGMRLGEAGYRVAYVGEAKALGEMVSHGADARSQRQRWESGRRELAKAHAWRLIRRGLARRNLLVLDLGADLLMPPLTRVAEWTALGLIASSVVAVFCLRQGVTPLAWIPWSLLGACLAAYVLQGLRLSGVGARGLLDLACAPFFMAWKLVLPVRPPDTWVRTTREKLK